MRNAIPKTVQNGIPVAGTTIEDGIKLFLKGQSQKIRKVMYLSDSYFIWIGLDWIGLDRLTKELGNPGNVSTVHGLVIMVYYPRFVYFSIVFRVC